MTLLPNNQQLSSIDFCQYNTSEHFSLPSLRNNYHAQAMVRNPHFRSNFYSYYDNQTLSIGQNTLSQRAFSHELSILTSLWLNMHPKILQLHHKLYRFHYFHRRSLYYSAERRIYAHYVNMKHLASSWTYEIDARDKATQNLNELNHLVNYFAITLPSIRQRFRTLYLLKLQSTVLRILQNDFSLRPGILYTHTYTNGQLHSVPYKRNIHLTSGDFTKTTPIKKGVADRCN